MNNPETIKQQYAEAVRGIQKEWLENNYDAWYQHVVNLPIKPKITYLVLVLDNQVFNGGFHQYFANGYGQFVEEAVEALMKIGATYKAELLRKAFDKVNANRDDYFSFRKKLIRRDIEILFKRDELASPLDELDTLYEEYQLEDIGALLTNYLESGSVSN